MRGDLLAYARSIADSPEEAEDLVSDALERAARAEGRPRDPDALRPWMFRVIRNLNVDELRKRRIRREYSLSATRLDDRGAAVGNSVEDAIFLREAFDALEPKQREVLFLVDIMGMTYKEAAAAMNVPPGTVMSRVSRARGSLLSRMDSGQVISLKKGKQRE